MTHFIFLQGSAGLANLLDEGRMNGFKVLHRLVLSLSFYLICHYFNPSVWHYILCQHDQALSHISAFVSSSPSGRNFYSSFRIQIKCPLLPQAFAYLPRPKLYVSKDLKHSKLYYFTFNLLWILSFMCFFPLGVPS